LLIKLSPSSLNVGLPGVATSKLGLATVRRMEVGGKLGLVTPWQAQSTWFRAAAEAGKTLRLDSIVELETTAVPCDVGEKTLYSFDPVKIDQASLECDSIWSFSTPEMCLLAQRNGATLPSKKCAIQSCAWCQAGTYSVDVLASTCHDCATQTLAKYYSKNGKKVRSKIFVEQGADCSRGGSWIYPKPGYWRNFMPGDFIYKCPMGPPPGPGSSPSCIGGTNVTTPCREGYTGVLCAVCDKAAGPSGYANAGKVCTKCGGLVLNGDAISLFVILGVMIIVLAKALYDKWFGGGDIKGTKALKILMKKKKIAARAKAIIGQVKILIAYFQTLLAFIMGGEVNFPTDFSSLMDSFEFVNVDLLAILRGTCLIPDIDFYGIFMFNFAAPILVTIGTVLHYFISKVACGPADDEAAKGFGAFHWALFCTMCFFIYPNTSRVMLTMFRCHKVQLSPTETRSYLYADYSIECYEGSYDMYMILALVGVLLYPIGIPAFFIMKLRGYSRVSVNGLPMTEDPGALPMLKDPVVEEAWGAMYARFKLEYYWYETSEMARKLLVGSLTMFIQPGSATQIISAIAANTFFMIMIMYCWPFKTYDDNMLMTISLVATTVTLFGALIVTAQIDLLDAYADGVSQGLLMGTTAVLFVLYLVMLIRFQLPVICNPAWGMLPDCILKSWLNCYRPGACCGPPAKVEAPPVKEAPEEGTQEIKMSTNDSTNVSKSPGQSGSEVEMNTEEIDRLIETYFHRYDLDESGTLNSVEELQQLSTNLSFKLRLPLTGEEIDAIVASAGELSDGDAWDLNQFSEWFKRKFVSP